MSKSTIGEMMFPVSLALFALIFVTATSRLDKIKPPTPDIEMQIALPKFMQVILAGGDRFLAANVTVFRALTSSADTNPSDHILVQAKIQSDAAWLNPRHEDNYYLAAAALSWNGQVEAAQHILAKATDTRPFDKLPPFFYAFNQYYFNHDPINGAKWLMRASKQSSDPEERSTFNKLAAHWMEKGHDRIQALKMLEALAAQSRQNDLKNTILLRAKRVRHLILLDSAIENYIHSHHTPPESLEKLLQTGLLEELPTDPLGQGYIIDSEGKAQIKQNLKK